MPASSPALTGEQRCGGDHSHVALAFISSLVVLEMNVESRCGNRNVVAHGGGTEFDPLRVIDRPGIALVRQRDLVDEAYAFRFCGRSASTSQAFVSALPAKVQMQTGLPDTSCT